ncbi:Coiled-coil and C2 domain-containing protein 1-like protein, partial [Fragariocoptes setiger]
MATKTTQGATGSNVLLEDLENPESDLPKMADSNDMVPMDQTLSKAAIVDNQENQPHPIGSSNSAEPSEELEDNGFVVLNNDATNTPSDADRNRTDLYHELEKQLQDQISRCKNYMEIFTQAHGDMTKVSQFRTFSEIAQKNLDLLRFRWKNGDKFPLVKHETFNFLIIPTNTELGSNDLSVEFVRGINLKVSERSYTYMKLEFPYPQTSYGFKGGNDCENQTSSFQQRTNQSGGKMARVCRIGLPFAMSSTPVIL